MSNIQRTLLMLSASCLLGGCAEDFSLKDLFFVELEEERICKKWEGEVIPAAEMGSEEVSKVIPFSIPGKLQDSAVRRLGIQITELSVEADVPKLNSIEEALLVVRPEGSTDPSLEKRILAYKRQSETNSQVVRLRGEEVDLTSLNDGPMEIFVLARGALPNEEWTMRVQACWAVRVRVSYLDLLAPVE